MDERLKSLEAAAIERLKQVPRSKVYVAHSGGKDSVVVHHLARKVFGDGVPVVHTPKIAGFNKVHEATIDFIYEMAAKFGCHMVPGDKMKSFLSDFNLDIQIDGTRRDEGERTDRSSDVVIDGKTIPRAEMPHITFNGLFGQTSLFPILDWSDDDVWAYIESEEIAVTEEYRILAAR